MFQSQHFVDLPDSSSFGDPKSWLSGQDGSSPTRSSMLNTSIANSSAAAGPNANLDRGLYNDLVEIVPLVQSLIERKASSSFTRRGSVVYTKTPSRDSLSRRMDPKGRIIAQSIPTNKKRERGEKEQGKSVNPSDADSFSLFSAKSFSSEKEKEELVLLREQLEDLQKHLLEKDELLKSAENTKRQMTTISAKLDALKVQSAEKDAIMKSTHSQLSETKIKLADRQAALEKIQWEAMTSNRKVEKLEEELKTMHGDISSFMLLLESLAKNNSDVLVNDYDFAVCQLENDPSIDNLDEMEIEKIEEATKAYITALAVAKEKQDEESIAAATAARLHLQSFVLGNNISDVHYTKHT